MLEIKIDTRSAIKQLEKLTGPEYTKGKYEGFKAMAGIVRDRAKQTTMFDDKTGILRSRWRINKKTRRNRDGTTESMAVLKNTAPHAHLIIYGRKQRGTGKKSKPRPFIQRAAQESGIEQMHAAGRAMTDFLSKLALSNPHRTKI